jgi:membrane-associated phospholipid phosphatase
MKALPVDRLLGYYNAALAVVWCTAIPRDPWAPAMVALHAVGAAFPWLLARLPARLPRAVHVVREGYPWFLFVPLWSELGWLAAIRRLPTHDHAIAELDRAIFGTHYHLTWMHAWPDLAEPMYFFYILYYPTIFVPLLALALRRRVGAFREWSFRLLLSYLGCYLSYLIFPVIGPRALAAHVAPVGGALAWLSESLHSAGDSPGTAFPSSHVAGAATIAWLAWRRLPRLAAWLLTAQAAGVAAATIYTGNHFTVDVMAGLAWVAVLQAVAAPWFEGRSSHNPAGAEPTPGAPIPQHAPGVLPGKEGVSCL